MLAVVQPPTIGSIAAREAAHRHFERERRDVLIADRIRNRVRRSERIQIDEIEHRAEIHCESFVTLTDERAAAYRSPGMTTS